MNLDELNDPIALLNGEIARLREALDAALTRAEAAEDANRNLADYEEAYREAERERDAALARLRETAQTLITRIGAAGPMNAEEAAQRAVEALDAALARAETAERERDAARAEILAQAAWDASETAFAMAELRRERDEALRSARISEAGRLAAEKVAQEDDQFLPLYEALAQVKALRGALERVIEIEAECPTWWDDPTVGGGAVARAALSTTPAASLEAHDGRVARSALEHAAGIPWIGKPPASPWGEVQAWLLHLAAAIECDEE